MNHNWHVHMNPAVINSACTSAVIGGHYNPFNVSLGKIAQSQVLRLLPDTLRQYR